MPHLSSMSKNASLFDVFKMFPEASIPLIQLNEVLLRGPSPFTSGERELIATYVSGLNECQYCQGVHMATAELLGVSRSAVPQAFDDIEAAPVAEKMKPVLRYAHKLTRQPSSVQKSDVDAILAAGWDESVLFHVVAVTALFNFMNRLVEGMGIKLEPSYVKPAAERLAKLGYTPLIAMLTK